MKRKEAVKRKEARECLSQLRLACELIKLIRRFFRIYCQDWEQSLIQDIQAISLIKAISF